MSVNVHKTFLTFNILSEWSCLVESKLSENTLFVYRCFFFGKSAKTGIAEEGSPIPTCLFQFVTPNINILGKTKNAHKALKRKIRYVLWYECSYTGGSTASSRFFLKASLTCVFIVLENLIVFGWLPDQVPSCDTLEHGPNEIHSWSRLIRNKLINPMYLRDWLNLWGRVGSSWEKADQRHLYFHGPYFCPMW